MVLTLDIVKMATGCVLFCELRYSSLIDCNPVFIQTFYTRTLVFGAIAFDTESTPDSAARAEPFIARYEHVRVSRQGGPGHRLPTRQNITYARRSSNNGSVSGGGGGGGLQLFLYLCRLSRPGPPIP